MTALILFESNIIVDKRKGEGNNEKGGAMMMTDEEIDREFDLEYDDDDINPYDD